MARAMVSMAGGVVSGAWGLRRRGQAMSSVWPGDSSAVLGDVVSVAGGRGQHGQGMTSVGLLRRGLAP